MSAGWSFWVMFLVVLNMGITFFLYLWGPRAKIPTLPDGTSGHVWAHGVLREGVRPLPMWWVLFSGAMFVAGFVYLALFPGFGNFKGVLGWTSHDELARHVAANRAELAPLMDRFKLYPVEQLAADPKALQMGKVLFEDNCAACHQRSAKGNMALGAPDLTDNDWLYGGSGSDITTSIHDGRSGVMPPWASLGADNVKNLAQYVLSLSGSPHDAAKAAAGQPLFATCAACHGADGKGNQALGAPNLTDHIWLHGGSVADIEKTIGEGRQGHMPAWSPRLSDEQIHVLAAYVYHQSHQTSDASRQ
ncbi:MULTISPECIES: cytochrome-c oxidase, cbb3-type subunit III [unclassified Rhodanobacter]|uniref:cytochrome-c oxidase, cbb3-type subunit III n=1 Tax=unclassified Rhodanobacter TaxID=2621553 RepID=UPI0007A9A98F|nr:MULTISPECIES: cytochrome-c oxidase, cbb3-type subunit III [unclassified Rhodanobacter]KZC15334.1 cytochrome C oxidase Cbb3 [Rhodanobacter sp. FW104-R8]KZC25899.1 cytochrome C oxidase Cbb3 [Rhodanobacter sp. FW510-T8]KZC33727.1 cytochrome C oxidase Cbb3 [Rhodanobacter sp. FW510-R10]